MSQRISYGLDNQAVADYYVVVCWYLAFDIEVTDFNPAYIPTELIQEIEQLQRLNIIKRLPDHDAGRKWLILFFFPNGI